MVWLVRFNAGSALTSGALAVSAFIVTNTAACAELPSHGYFLNGNSKGFLQSSEQLQVRLQD